MKPIDYSLRYATVFKTKKLRADMERIAREENRSLNFVINQACEEYVKGRGRKP